MLRLAWYTADSIRDSRFDSNKKNDSQVAKINVTSDQLIQHMTTTLHSTSPEMCNHGTPSRKLAITYCTCQIADEAIVNVFHEDLPPDVNEIDHVWHLSLCSLDALSRTVVTQIPRFNCADKMRHFRRLTKPSSQKPHTVHRPL